MPVEEKNLLKSIQIVTNHYKPYLSSTLRYERFMDGESPKQWISLLGPDVCLLTHANTTETLTKKFIAYNVENGLELSSDELLKLRIAPLIHDWGEIVVDGEGIGDITFEKKNSDHEIIETVIFNKVISIINDEIIKEGLQKIYLEVVMKGDKKLGEWFNAIERLGYLETAIQAFNGTNGKRINNWRGLVGNVLSNQIVKLQAYSQKYPYVTFYLKDKKKIISDMFEETVHTDVPLDNTKGPSFDCQKLKEAYTSWKLK